MDSQSHNCAYCGEPIEPGGAISVHKTHFHTKCAVEVIKANELRKQQNPPPVNGERPEDLRVM